ncbi:hypothetical protein [Jiulongibacter sp. NS-SX5]|uniref:hypothetical protein n=1 Tax=Jiulongibacter sp. NS-SX5 TaxID=3463854 RepID=UPI00405A4806
MKRNPFLRLITITALAGSIMASCTKVELSDLSPQKNEEHFEESKFTSFSEMKKIVGPDGKQYLVTEKDYYEIQEVLAKKENVEELNDNNRMMPTITRHTINGILQQLSTNSIINIFYDIYGGNYLCNTYRSYNSFTLSSGSYAYFDEDYGDGATLNGFEYTNPINSGTPQRAGITQTGSTYEMNTYSIIPHHTTAGTPVMQKVLPQSLTGNQFKYSVFTP